MPASPIPTKRGKDRKKPLNGATVEGESSTARSRRVTTSDPAQPSFAPPPKMRRRPLVAIAGVGLVILSALAAVLAYRSLGQGHDIVAVRTTIHRGELIAREDLMTVRVGTDPALRPLAATDLSTIVGKRAAMDLSAGGVVTQDAIAPVVVPASGESLIGVQLTTAQMPSEPLLAGDQVRLVAIPKTNGAAASDQGSAKAPETITGTVLSTRATPRGDGRIVDVRVTVPNAPTWAARAALNQVALVLETRDR